jgi:hypothetical protein
MNNKYRIFLTLPSPTIGEGINTKYKMVENFSKKRFLKEI